MKGVDNIMTASEAWRYTLMGFPAALVLAQLPPPLDLIVSAHLESGVPVADVCLWSTDDAAAAGLSADLLRKIKDLAAKSPRPDVRRRYPWGCITSSDVFVALRRAADAVRECVYGSR